jgi:hypothetical protein
MAKITFNLSQTSLAPGWNPDWQAHDDLWRNFAAGYEYSVAGTSTKYDSLRGSDPATGGSSDTFSSAAGSLDLTAHNFAGNVSLDWFGETAQLALDSAWNTIKNAYVSDFTGHELALKNWVDVWVALDNSFDQEVFVDGAKRAEISTGLGNDVIWVGVDSNGAGWTNHIKLDSGDGNDRVTVALATHDYSASAFSAAYNPAWTTTEIHAGAGNDLIEGGKNADTIDGGDDVDTVVLHGNTADYNLSTDSGTGITTIVDLRPSSANMDGTDHLTNVEFVQFNDQTVSLIEHIGSHDEFGLFTPQVDVPDGGTVIFTLVLPEPAASGGTLVSLAASPNNILTLPSTILVPEGQSTFTFSGVVQSINGAFDFTVLATIGGTTYEASGEIKHSGSSFNTHDSLSDPGAIAFTGVNTDGDNDIAFVALTDIQGNRTIEFGEAFANGAFSNPNSHWAWAAPAAGIAAGTVITIDHIHSAGSISTNIGTVTGSGDLTGRDEAVFAYTSEITPDGLTRHFLAGISNSTFQASGSNLTETGLTPGTNALEFGNHVDIAEYTGPRTTLRSPDDYLAELTSPANWISQSASGDQSHDGIAPGVPFHTTHFEWSV